MPQRLPTFSRMRENNYNFTLSLTTQFTYLKVSGIYLLNTSKMKCTMCANIKMYNVIFVINNVQDQ